jgi:hypothetical protein
MLKNTASSILSFVLVLILTSININPTFAQPHTGQAFQVTDTAFKFDPNGRDIQLAHSDGTPILPSEVEEIFESEEGSSIFAGELLITSSFYGGQTGLEAQKRVVFQDLSDEAGWPNIHVIPNTVAVDPRFGRFKFADGDDDPPEVVGSVNFHWGGPYRGAKRGDFYYLCNGESDNSLLVIDVSDPANPQLASMGDAGWAYHIEFTGDFAYVTGTHSNLHIFDISDPYSISKVGLVKLPYGGKVGRVLQKKDLMYVPQMNNRIYEYDISDPSNPQYLRFTTLPGQTGEWIPILYGNFAFIFEKSTESTLIMNIIDISDFSNCSLLSRTEVSQEPVYVFIDETKLAFNGSLIYLVTGGDGLKIFDLSDPGNPIILGEYEKITEMPPNWQLKDTHQGIALSENYVYISGHLGTESTKFGYNEETNNGFVFIVDVTDPSSPALINEFVKNENFTDFYDIEVENHIAYIVDINFGLLIVDLSDNTHPFPLMGGYRSAGEGSDVYVYGDYAYVAQNLGGGVSIIDISNKSNPQMVGFYHAGFNVWGIEGVENKVVYVTGPWVGNSPRGGRFSIAPPIHVVDVRDPTNPQLVKKLKGYFSFNPKMHDNLLFTNDAVYNVSDPFDPELCWDPFVPSRPFPTNFIADIFRLAAYPLCMRGDYLYRAGYFSFGSNPWDQRFAFTVVDIADFSNATIEGLIYIPLGKDRPTSNMVVRSDYAFFPAGVGNGLQIADISNPQEPIHLGELSPEKVGKSLQTVDMDGKYLYTQNYWPWHKIFHISEIETNPAGPLPIKIKQKVAEMDLFYSWRTRINGDYAYNVALNGLNIIDIPRGSEAPLTPLNVNYFPAAIQVAIDIKPGSGPNSINCKNKNGIIPVAIITTDDFDATSVDHRTVRFGKEGTEASETHKNKKTGELKRHEEDVDGDGDIDLGFHFRFEKTELDCEDEEAWLTGETYDGQAIEGKDAIRTVGGKLKKEVALESELESPAEYALLQNYPNPFNPRTTISYSIPISGRVQLSVFDVFGRKATALADKYQSPGTYSITWDGRDQNQNQMPSGVYFVKLKADDLTIVRKMLLVR